MRASQSVCQWASTPEEVSIAGEQAFSNFIQWETWWINRLSTLYIFLWKNSHKHMPYLPNVYTNCPHLLLLFSQHQLCCGTNFTKVWMEKHMIMLRFTMSAYTYQPWFCMPYCLNHCSQYNHATYFHHLRFPHDPLLWKMSPTMTKCLLP